MDDELLRDALRYADQWLAYQQQLREIPGMAVAVRHGDQLVLSRAYGHANLETGTPLTTDHVFRVASHSKWFTATAIMQLRERSKLRLDDPLAQHISWLSGPVAAATIRQVLNHAAGITRDGYDNDHWELLHAFPDHQQLRALVLDGGAVLAPNRMLKYSNIGYALLGEVIQSAGGLAYNDYVRLHIVNPLGLTSTGPETNAEAQSRLVTGYTSRTLLIPRFPLPDVPTGAMSAATGFYSTAEQLTSFAGAHFFGNTELISDDSKREMQRPYWPVTDMDSYGLGMQVLTIGERTTVGHSGGFPGHTTRTLLDPEDKFALSVLTNETGGVAGELAKSVIKLIDLALKQDPPDKNYDLDRYTGRFVGLWGFFDIARLGSQLFLFSPDMIDPTTDGTKLAIVDSDTLRLEEKDGYGSPGESIRYQRTGDGSIDRVTMAGRTLILHAADPEYLRRRCTELAVPAAK